MTTQLPPIRPGYHHLPQTCFKFSFIYNDYSKHYSKVTAHTTLQYSQGGADDAGGGLIDTIPTSLGEYYSM
jgi:hypothetical protein